MKKLLYLSSYIIFSFFYLIGCSSLYSNYREAEQLLLIEAIGVDASPTGVRLTLAPAAASEQRDTPPLIQAQGLTLAAAFQQARNLCTEKELFFSPVNAVLVGREAADAHIEEILSYICQSPFLRSNLPVYILRDISASQCMEQLMNARQSAADQLQGITSQLRAHGPVQCYSASDLLCSHLRRDSSLACALVLTSAETQDSDTKPEQSPSETASMTGSSDAAQTGETSPAPQAKSLAVSGYGIFREGRLLRFLNADQSLGASLLLNRLGVSSISVTDPHGNPAVLELSDCSCSILPVWSREGQLTRLDVAVSLSCSAAQLEQGGDLTDAEYSSALTSILDAYVADCIGEVLRISSRSQSDFLSLSSSVEQDAPLLFRHLEGSFPQLLSQTEFHIAVHSQLIHANDLKEILL